MNGPTSRGKVTLLQHWFAKHIKAGKRYSSPTVVSFGALGQHVLRPALTRRNSAKRSLYVPLQIYTKRFERPFSIASSYMLLLSLPNQLIAGISTNPGVEKKESSLGLKLAERGRQPLTGHLE